MRLGGRRFARGSTFYNIHDATLLVLLDDALPGGRVPLEHALRHHDARLLAHSLEDQMSRVRNRLEVGAPDHL